MLSVVRVNSYDEALALINSGAFGNGTAIFTNDGGAARRFQIEVEVGHDSMPMFRSRCRWPTTPSEAGRRRCSATPRRTGRTAFASSPVKR